MKIIVTESQVWLDGRPAGTKICCTAAEDVVPEGRYTRVIGTRAHKSWSNNMMPEELRLAKMQAEAKFGRRSSDSHEFRVNSGNVKVIREVPLGQLMSTTEGYKTLTLDLAMALIVEWAKSHIR